MNNLNRHINANERLVIGKAFMKPEYQALKDRIIIAEDGFGLEAFTSSTHIHGYFEIDKSFATIRGTEISVEETEEVQKHDRKLSLDEVVALIEDKLISQHESDQAKAMSDNIKEYFENLENESSNHYDNEFPTYYDSQGKEHNEF